MIVADSFVKSNNYCINNCVINIIKFSLPSHQMMKKPYTKVHVGILRIHGQSYLVAVECVDIVSIFA